MAKLTSQLIISLVDGVTAPSRAIAKTVGNLRNQLELNNQKLAAMRGQMVETAAIGYGLYRAIRAPVVAAIEFESAMADVRKVVDFGTPEAFNQMSSDIVEMSTVLPMAANDIAAIVAAAGQANVASNELLPFAEMAAKVGIAFDMAAGDVGTALAKIKTQLNYSVEQTGALADAINYLSNTSAAAAPDIVEYMKRVASTGEMYGFTADQTAAIGAAMIAAGAEAEVAATSFRNVGKALSKGGSATKRQAAAFQRLGLDVTEVAKRFNEDATGTLREVITRINELPEHLRANALSEIFGDEARALAPLVGQIELYDKALAGVAQQATYLGSSQKEYEARAATTANNMQLFRNKVEAAQIAIGSALLPALNDVMDALGPVVLRIADFAEANPRLTQSIIALTAGLVGLKVAALAARFAFLWMRGSALMAAIGGLQALQGVMAGARIALLSVLNPMRLVRGAMVALRAAFLLSGIGAVIAAIALGGLWIYNNWANIGEAFAAFKKAFLKAIKPIEKTLEPVTELFSGLLEFVGGLVRPIDDATGAFARFGSELGGAVGYGIRRTVDFLRDLPGIINGSVDVDWATVGRRIVDGLKAGLDWAWAGVAFAWDWAGKLLSDFADSDLIQGVRERFAAIDWAKAIAGAGEMSGAVYSWMADQIAAVDAAKLGRDLAHAVTAAVTGAFDIAAAISDAVTGADGGAMRAAVSDALAAAFEGMGEVAKSIIRQTFDFSAAFWAEIFGATAMVDAVKAALDDVVAFFAGLPARIKSAIGTIDVSSFIKWPTWLGGEAAKATAPARATLKRAHGGPVQAMRAYRVGEHGEETFIPRVSGYIANARDTAALVDSLTRRAPAPVAMSGFALPQPRAAPANDNRTAANNNRAAPITITNHVTVQGSNASPEDIAQAIGREAAFLLRGHFSDGGR